MQSCFLHHRSVFIHPSYLLKNGIPFTVISQKPGQLVLPDFRGAHEGWNTGPNLAISANFLDAESLQYIRQSMFTGDSLAPWPCVCGQYTNPYKRGDGLFDINARPPRLNVTISGYRWIHYLSQFADIPLDFLMEMPLPSDPFHGKYLIRIVWRYVNGLPNIA
jgi:hypothetical protein